MASINDILATATQKLEGTGIDTPRLDAEVLLSHVLRIKRVDLILKRDKSIRRRNKLSDGKSSIVDNLLFKIWTVEEFPPSGITVKTLPAPVTALT